MALVKSVQLPPTPNEISFGKEWRREETWTCKHGDRKFINESGWVCYGSSLTCGCCGISYCYTDNFNDIMSEIHCSYCIEDKERGLGMSKNNLKPIISIETLLSAVEYLNDEEAHKLLLEMQKKFSIEAFVETHDSSHKAWPCPVCEQRCYEKQGWEGVKYI